MYLVGFALAVAAGFDKGAAGVAIANQAFERWHLQAEGHGVGRRLAGVGHRHDDRVVVDRHRLQPSQFFAQRLAREIHAAVVQRAGHVGEVDPLEEAVPSARLLGETLDRNLAVDRS